MDKSDPPTSFGISKPVGHIVIAFRSVAKAQLAVMTLLADGFADADLVRYTAKEMRDQMEALLLAASPLAEFGREVSLAKAHLDLARRGCSFLVVHAPRTEQAERVARLASAMKAVTAHRHGLLVVEDVMDEPDATTPAAEPSEG